MTRRDLVGLLAGGGVGGGLLVTEKGMAAELRSADAVGTLPPLAPFVQLPAMLPVTGGYPFHCHNTVHEDHHMMRLYDVAEVGEDKTRP